MSRVGREKRKFPEIWGWEEQEQQIPSPARNTTLRGRDSEKGGKVGRHGKRRKRRVAGRLLSRKKAEGGARRDRQRWRGTRGAWESWLLQAGPTPRAHPAEALLKMAALLPLPLPPPPELRALPSVAPGVCAPGADTHQAEEVGMAILQAGPVRHEAGTHPHSHNPHAIIPQPPTRKKETDRERGREGETDSERERGRGALHTHK